MDFLPKDDLLECSPNVLEELRSKYNLNGPGRMKEAVNILHEWIQKQPHFKKKDFPPVYLETCLIGRKGSIERTKKLLDKLCTIKTLLPNFFGKTNVQTDFGDFYSYVTGVVLPKPTKNDERVFLYKIYNACFTTSHNMAAWKQGIVMCEYLRMHDYSNGVVAILDLSGVTNIMDFVTHVDLVLMKQSSYIHLECIGMRLNSVHIITESKFVNAVISILRQVVSAKIGSRIFHHKSITELYDIFDRKYFPEEYGGEEKPLQELSRLWKEKFASEEHLNFLEEMSTATTDESYRPTDTFNDQYAGLPGTFRVLKVD